MNNKKEKLKLLLSEYSGIPELEIKDNDLIDNDLSITGDDGYILIKKIRKEFDLNINDFTIKDYFYNEPNFFISDTRERKPLRVKDLFHAIEIGLLKDEIIDENNKEIE